MGEEFEKELSGLGALQWQISLKMRLQRCQFNLQQRLFLASLLFSAKTKIDLLILA